MIDNFPKIWVLTDNKPGHTTQSIGVAEAFKLPYIEKKVKFNFFARFPNRLKSKNFANIKEKESDDLLFSQPNIVISSGRKLAQVSRHLKHLNPSIFTINCMNPDCDLKDFNLNIMPDHDNYEEKGNIIKVYGAINKVNKYFLFNEKIKWEKKFSHLKPKKISLFIGGGTRYSSYKPSHIKKLLSLANELALKENASLLITSSRRTEYNIKTLVKNHIGCSNYFYEYSSTSQEENPCNGFLAVADLHIVTGDSISMCSEAVSTGNPTFIFVADEVLQFKHRFFIEKLFNENYAVSFNDKLLDSNIQDVTSKKLYEGERIHPTLMAEYQKFFSALSLKKK